MEHDLTDHLERRLRAARPPTARVDERAYDAALLARVRDMPIAARRNVPRAVALPVAAGVTLTATAVVMFAGGPGDVGGPSSASAVTQALRWLDPPSGTILHARSVETQGGNSTTREVWQAGDDPASQRLIDGGVNVEISDDGFYDPATNTIYRGSLGAGPGPAKKGATGMAQGMPAGDPVVAKVRMLLQRGHMTVTGPEVHNGTEAWVIALKADAGRPVWTLWVSAADGKPLELRDPGRDATEEPQVVRWPTYEVVPAAQAEQQLSLTGAHPSARVVTDPAQVAAAEARLLPADKAK